MHNLQTPRLHEYIAYHNESMRIGDVDPSHKMLRYICERFELNLEQRYWLAFIYALTYNGASTFYAYNEFPDYENVNIDRMTRWWFGEGREKIVCTTDRRWVRSMNLFVPAVESYRRELNECPQDEVFRSIIAVRNTPEERYDAVYKWAKRLVSFGQFSLFLYLEALDTVTPLGLVPTDLDLSKAWSCRNGLCYAYEMDEIVTEPEMPTPAEHRGIIADAWRDIRRRLKEINPGVTVWNIETTLCAYRKWHDGKRYVGYYLDREAAQIARMQDHVPDGVFWDVLWQYRQEVHPTAYLAENTGCVGPKGIRWEWKEYNEARTAELLKNI